MMRHLFTRLFLGAMTLLAVSCGGSDGYVIECDFDGLGDRGVEMVTSDGKSVTRRQLHPRDGKFRAEGSSREPELVELYTLDGGALLYTCVVSDGDRLKVSMDMEQGTPSLKVEGPEAWAEYGAWLAENDSLLVNGADGDVNRLIAEYAGEHRDSPASGLLVASRFRAKGNELMADSVMNLISAQGRPTSVTASFMASLSRGLTRTRKVNRFLVPAGRDTSITYVASEHSYTLIAVNSSRKPDSVAQRLRELYKAMPAKRFDIIELSVARDSGTWRGNILGDSARWRQGWLPGGVASPRLTELAVAAVPYYILTDSTGLIVYDGVSVTRADTLVRRLLGHPATPREEIDTDTLATAATPAATAEAAVPDRPGKLKIKPAKQ